jgi:mRNA interferase MazF
MKRYDVFYVRLDPTEGSEMAKTRPAVVVSLDVLNAALPVVVVCPLSSRLRPEWRSRIQVTVAGKKSDICVEQIRTVNKTRLTTRLGTLKTADSLVLRKLITDMYGEA